MAANATAVPALPSGWCDHTDGGYCGRPYGMVVNVASGLYTAPAGVFTTSR